MNRVLAPTCVSQLRTTFAVISAPLSDRMCSGTPRMSMTSAIVSRTPKLLRSAVVLNADAVRANLSCGLAFSLEEIKVLVCSPFVVRELDNFFELYQLALMAERDTQLACLL